MSEIKKDHHPDSVAITPDILRRANSLLQFKIGNKKLITMQWITEDHLSVIDYIFQNPRELLNFFTIKAPRSFYFLQLWLSRKLQLNNNKLAEKTDVIRAINKSLLFNIPITILQSFASRLASKNNVAIRATPDIQQKLELFDGLTIGGKPLSEQEYLSERQIYIIEFCDKYRQIWIEFCSIGSSHTFLLFEAWLRNRIAKSISREHNSIHHLQVSFKKTILNYRNTSSYPETCRFYMSKKISHLKSRLVTNLNFVSIFSERNYLFINCLYDLGNSMFLCYTVAELYNVFLNTIREMNCRVSANPIDPQRIDDQALNYSQILENLKAIITHKIHNTPLADPDKRNQFYSYLLTIFFDITGSDRLSWLMLRQIMFPLNRNLLPDRYLENEDKCTKNFLTDCRAIWTNDSNSLNELIQQTKEKFNKFKGTIKQTWGVIQDYEQWIELRNKSDLFKIGVTCGWSACPFNCKFCYENIGWDVGAVNTTYVEIVNLLLSSGAKDTEIKITGGDSDHPLLGDPLILVKFIQKLIEQVRQLRIQYLDGCIIIGKKPSCMISLNTRGVMYGERGNFASEDEICCALTKLREAGLNQLSISLDGLTEKGLNDLGGINNVERASGMYKAREQFVRVAIDVFGIENIEATFVDLPSWFTEHNGCTRFNREDAVRYVEKLGLDKKRILFRAYERPPDEQVLIYLFQLLKKKLKFVN